MDKLIISIIILILFSLYFISCIYFERRMGYARDIDGGDHPIIASTIPLIFFIIMLVVSKDMLYYALLGMFIEIIALLIIFYKIHNRSPYLRNLGWRSFKI